MTFLGKKVVVSIPDSVLEEHASPREKTTKLGSIARTCAIFGVDLIEVFRVERGPHESEKIRKVLEYLETPQYLRRRAFPMDEDLKFAGLLPPLKTPSHKARVFLKDIEVGEVREGITNGDGTVDVGLEEAPRLRDKTPANRRVTVRVTGKGPLTAEVIGREKAGEYWGYEVEVKSLEEAFDGREDLLEIATSKLGDPVRTSMPQLIGAVGRARGVKFIFGSPSRGLFDIIGPSLREKADFVLNLFSEQHVQTVRTEEAISAALALLNFLQT